MIYVWLFLAVFFVLGIFWDSSIIIAKLDRISKALEKRNEILYKGSQS
jgi:hypothetical protein